MMSRGNRPKPPRQHRPRPEVELAFSAPALCVDDEDQIDKFMHLTHDYLIKHLGARRRSGIRWHIIRGREASESYIRTFFGEDPSTFHVDVTRTGLTAALDQYLAGLAECGDRAVIVVATCEAVRP